MAELVPDGESPLQIGVTACLDGSKAIRVDRRRQDGPACRDSLSRRLYTAKVREPRRHVVRDLDARRHDLMLRRLASAHGSCGAPLLWSRRLPLADAVCVKENAAGLCLLTIDGPEPPAGATNGSGEREDPADVHHARRPGRSPANWRMALGGVVPTPATCSLADPQPTRRPAGSMGQPPRYAPRREGLLVLRLVERRFWRQLSRHLASRRVRLSTR